MLLMIMSRLKRKALFVNLICLLFFPVVGFCALTQYGEQLCKQQGFKCLKIKRSDSWGSLFPKAKERELYKRINRMNAFLKAGMTLAIPNNPSDYLPMPLTVSEQTKPLLVVNKQRQAWAAYDKHGNLIRWGPVSTGRSICGASNQSCKTPSGHYHALYKKGKNCYSGSYPKLISGEQGGAPMPYCIYFYKGYTIHGSNDLPGYPSSHGCVNLFMDDARWLNEQFIKTAQDGYPGTGILIQ
jgi:hypothetical protein